MDDKKASGHSPVLAFLIVFTTLVYGFRLFIAQIAVLPLGSQLGWFSNNTAFGDPRYDTNMTPSSWTFSVLWWPIYAWQVIWLLYVIIGLFRKNSEGAPLYNNPANLTSIGYIAYIANNGAAIAYQFVWDMKYTTYSLIFLALLPLTLFVCLFNSLKRLNEHGNHMMRVGMRKDIWMIRLFIQNGMGMYATWGTIASLITFLIDLHLVFGVEKSLGTTIIVCVLAAVVLAWFILDNFVLDRFTRYLLTPYIVVCLAFAGILTRRYTPGETNSIIFLTLMVASSVMMIVKIVIMIFRHYKRPLFFGDDEPKKHIEAANATGNTEL